MSAEWVNIRVAANLVGLDYAVVARRAHEGLYGAINNYRGTDLISTRGLELASRLIFTSEQITAAKNDEPLPPGDEDPNEILDHPSLEEIGARVVRADHQPVSKECTK